MRVDRHPRMDYTVQGPPGAGFLHAAHALLDLGVSAHVDVDALSSRRASVQDSPAAEHPVGWPSGLDRLGPDDGSAACVLLRGCSAVDVVDGSDRLSFRWFADAPKLRSLLIWRNLGGWPQPNPYRTTGVEPMVGAAIDQHHAATTQLARLPLDGIFRWSLHLEASRSV